MSKDHQISKESDLKIAQSAPDLLSVEGMRMADDLSNMIQGAMSDDGMLQDGSETSALENSGHNEIDDSRAKSSSYESRKAAYIDANVPASQSTSVVFQAFKGLPVSEDRLQHYLKRVLANRESSDFAMIVLVRLLMFQPQFKERLQSSIENFRFWLTKGEEKHVYWSENHAIAYLSSEWLVEEQYGFNRDVDDLRKRLVHYLNKKVQWGYYEFFSPVYLPFTLSALLNLVDFSKDDEIKTLALAATNRLLHDLLIPVNDLGVLFSAAGRSYSEFLVKAGGKKINNINQMIYLLTGKGVGFAQSMAGDFLATSSYQPTPEIFEFWNKNVDMKLQIAHPFDQLSEVNKDLNRTDAILMAWSSGAYINTKVLNDTFWLINKYSLYKHSNFAKYGGGISKYLNYLAPLSSVIKKIKPLAPLIDGTVLTGAKVNIFKNEGVVLSSLQNYYPGYKGAQQVPWVANVGDVAVWSQAGSVPSLDKIPHGFTNTHLPKVKQDGNLLVAAYIPAYAVRQFYKEKDLKVWIYWRGMDEERQDGKWLFGRRLDNYVAIHSSCAPKGAGVWTCDKAQQSWVSVVGNKTLYQDFDHFCEAVKNEATVKVQNKKAGILNDAIGARKNEYSVDAEFGQRKVSIKWKY